MGDPFIQGLVGHAVLEDAPSVGDGTTREEVLRGKSHRVVLFFKEPGGNFFRPPSPPRRAERGGSFNCRQAVVIVDAGHPLSIHKIRLYPTVNAALQLHDVPC